MIQTAGKVLFDSEVLLQHPFEHLWTNISGKRGIVMDWTLHHNMKMFSIFLSTASQILEEINPEDLELFAKSSRVSRFQETWFQLSQTMVRVQSMGESMAPTGANY